MKKSIIVLALLLSGCPREENLVVDTRTFAAVYIALLEEGEVARQEEGRNGSFNPGPVLERFGVTREQMDATVRFYNEDLQRWKEFYTEVAALQGEPSRSPARRKSNPGTP